MKCFRTDNAPNRSQNSFIFIAFSVSACISVCLLLGFLGRMFVLMIRYAIRRFVFYFLTGLLNYTTKI